MKRRILFALAIVSLFTLAIAAFAVNQHTTTSAADMVSCCKDKTECPMKGKMAHGENHKDHKAMAEGKDCCGDSCPMKMGSSASSDAHGCSCDCCGDSCPMKKNEGAAAVSSEGGEKSCCDNCDCCSGKHSDTEQV